MKKHKPLLIAVVIVLLSIVGGVALWMSRPKDSAEGLDLPPEMLEPLPPLPTYTSWSQAALNLAKSNPKYSGLKNFAVALDSVDTRAVNDQRLLLKEILQNGWKESHPEVEALFASQSKAIQSAEAASNAPPFPMPPVADLDAPFPNLTADMLLVKLLLAKALKLESEGARDKAAREVARAMRFSERLMTQDNVLISHLIAIATLTESATVLESMLQKPGLTSGTLQSVLTGLQEIDEAPIGPGQAFRSEMRMHLIIIRRASKDANYRKTVLALPQNSNRRVARALSNAISRPYAFAAEYKKVVDAMTARLDQPYWRREAMGGVPDLATLTDDPILTQIMPGAWGEIAARFDGTKAHIRLCIALCARGLGNNDLANKTIDPFSGRPVRMTNQGVYSLGPDTTDQAASIHYDPTNGTKSVGDIVAQLPL